MHGWAIVLGIALARVAAADDGPIGSTIDVDTEALGAVGIQGMAAGATGGGLRTGPRYVWTSCDHDLQLRLGPSLGVWGGVAPFGHAAAGGKETWLVVSGDVEVTWLVQGGVRLGPEATVTAPSLASADTRYPTATAVSLGVRARYDSLTVALDVERAWAPPPSQFVPTTSGTTSLVLAAGVSGRPGLYAGGALLLLTAVELVVGSFARD